MDKSMSQEDYVTVVVTPKLTFQLLKRPEWQTVQDITQSELRRGFLSRFPPALWLSSEKFSFRPALPPTQRLTEETKTLFFKLVSDEVPDERVMLGILRELERSYEAIIRRAVTETRSEALQEQFTLQEQAEEVRREQAKHIKELRKEVKSLREQMQSIQKRLFLVEQEKDQLQREQHQTKEHVHRLEKQQAEQIKESKAESQDLREQMVALRLLIEGGAAAAVCTSTSATPSSSSLAVPAASQQPRAGASKKKGKASTAELTADGDAGAAPVSSSMRETEEARPSSRERTQVQTSSIEAPAEQDVLVQSSPEADPTDVSRRVDKMQQQLEAVQAWMLQGSQLLSFSG